jgi:hypothetical protein
VGWIKKVLIARGVYTTESHRNKILVC